MTSQAYEPVSHRNVPSTASPSLESTSSARLTPDSDSESSDDDGKPSRRQVDDGYEMKVLDGASRAHGSATTAHGVNEEEDALLEELSDGEETTTGRRRRRRASVQSFELYTPDEERAVRRKLDTHLVLCVALLYLLSFLDRSNM
jgi:hypothetical protein